MKFLLKAILLLLIVAPPGTFRSLAATLDRSDDPEQATTTSSQRDESTPSPQSPLNSSPGRCLLTILTPSSYQQSAAELVTNSTPFLLPPHNDQRYHTRASSPAQVASLFAHRDSRALRITLESLLL